MWFISPIVQISNWYFILWLHSHQRPKVCLCIVLIWWPSPQKNDDNDSPNIWKTYSKSLASNKYIYIHIYIYIHTYDTIIYIYNMYVDITSWFTMYYPYDIQLSECFIYSFPIINSLASKLWAVGSISLGPCTCDWLLPVAPEALGLQPWNRPKMDIVQLKQSQNYVKMEL